MEGGRCGEWKGQVECAEGWAEGSAVAGQEKGSEEGLERDAARSHQVYRGGWGALVRGAHGWEGWRGCTGVLLGGCGGALCPMPRAPRM